MIFEGGSSPKSARAKIERAIEAEFGFPIRVVVRDRDSVTSMAESTPLNWTDDALMRSYVMFLMNEVDEPSVLDRLIIKEDIDDVKYVPGAIIWRVDRDKVTRSGMSRLVSDDLYREMTIRSINTVRKLAGMMNDA